MDRKAFARCAAATSLGALLSVGCGKGGAEPALTTLPQARPASPPPAIVVSPEKEFFEPERFSSAEPQPSAPDTAHGTLPPETCPQPVDPWASETWAADSSVAETVVADDALQAVDSDGGQILIVATAADSKVETLAPVSAELKSSSELKFSVAGAPVPVENDAVETIKIAVRAPGEPATNDKASEHPSASTTTKPQSTSRYATDEAKRELRPVLVTPRTSPDSPSQDQSPKLAEREPQRPTPAAVTEQSLAQARMPKSKLVVPAPAPSPTAEPAVATATPTIVDEAAEVSAPEPVVRSEPTEVVTPEPVNVARTEPTPAKSPELKESSELESTLVVKVQPEAANATAPMAQVAPALDAQAERKSAKVAAVDQAPAESIVAETVPEAASAIAPTPVVAAAAPESVVVPSRVPARVEPAPVANVQPAPIAPAPVPPVPSVAAPPQQIVATPAAISPSVPLPQVPGTRSPAMVASLARADERVRHAIQLAEKGAMYASRKEFTSAIELIAQAHDVERGTRQHSQAVSAGLLAIKEAHDFVAPSRSEIDVVRLVAGHRTPVLKRANVSDLPPSLAAQYYYGYAKEHLAAGVGRETVGSIALYGLAKIIVSGAGHNSQQQEYTGPAMALYSAALICEPQNFRAAHELGVLLAGSGQLEMAREMLMGSVAQAPQPVMYQNLAVVHSRLGEQQLAQEAQQKASTLQQTMPDSKAPPVQWVDPATFATMGTGADANVPPKSAASSMDAAPTTEESTKLTPSVARKRPNTWNPLNLRR